MSESSPIRPVAMPCGALLCVLARAAETPVPSPGDPCRWASVGVGMQKRGRSWFDGSGLR